MKTPNVGSKLWRTLAWSGYTHRICTPEVIPGKRGGVIFRTHFADQFCKGWRIHSAGPRIHGLVVLVMESMPDDWTHLVVTGISRNGNLVFAKPATDGDLLGAYVSPGDPDWRKKLDEAAASGEWD